MNIHEQLTNNFYRWEQRGRGAELFPAPVELEPPFVAFPGHRLNLGNGVPDTGSRPTFLSGLADKFFRALQPPKPGSIATETALPTEEEPMPHWFGEKEPVMEFRLLFPGGATYAADAIGHFLNSVSLASWLMGLEIIGTENEVWLQVICQDTDATLVAQQLIAQFPDVKIIWSKENLLEVWADDDSLSERVVMDFGLHQEFMRPLETSSRIDPLVSLIGGMEHLTDGEVAVYQVLFTPLRERWADNVLAAVMKENGKPFFDDGADLVKQAQGKVARPLYGTVLRLAAKADSLPRTWAILRGMAPTLRLLSREGGQSLMPLPNTDYDHEEHCDDLLWRRSRRCGMILNLDEVVAMAHFPSASVKSAKLKRAVEGTSRVAPASTQNEINRRTLALGINEHDGDEVSVVLREDQRLQHMHCIGGTGMGKSTLLLSMLLQDLDYGRGFALIDPHGDLVDAVLAHVPSWRMDDVVLLDAADEENIIPFNILSAHSDYEKTLLASDLVSVFRRFSTSWGDRMGIIFQNLVLAFLEHPVGGTLADMEKFLIDSDWRHDFLSAVDDPHVRYYWEQTFPKLDGSKSVGPILTRLGALLTPKVIRYMVSQRENRLDFSSIMDDRRILLIRLPQGQMGKENAHMLGSLVMVKLQQMAMSRARMAVNQREPFFLYVDECQHFVTPSMAEILSGARKYGLGLILAHQDLHQLSSCPEVAAAVMSNVSTRIVFRVSENDARSLKGDFAHYEKEDFSALGRGEAICRVGGADQDFNLRVEKPEDIDPQEATATRQEAIETSRKQYTVPRSEVEAELRAKLAADTQKATPNKTSKQDRTKSDTVESVPDGKLGTSQVLPQQVDPAEVPSTNVEVGKTTDVSDNQKTGADSKSADPSIRPPGMGRGGQGHQMIVEQLASIGNSLGYATNKEASIANGRADITLISKHRRIAFEVAVNSNTAHEIENIEKCLSGEFDFVASISPSENTLKNIERAAKKTLTESDFTKVKFLMPNEVENWLAELGKMDAPISTPQASNTKQIGGRTVRVQRVEMSPSERKAMSEQQIEAIAAIVNRNTSEME